jgi:hypothetical protein
MGSDHLARREARGRDGGPAPVVEDVEFAILAYGDGFSHRRLHEDLGMIPLCRQSSRKRKARGKHPWPS